MLDDHPVLAAFLFIVGMLMLFSGLIVAGKEAGLNEIIIASVCSATAIASSAFIALLALRFNRKNSQEPWVITFRELHKEFWNDKKLEQVRMWLCCDEAYQADLVPVLNCRKAGTITAVQYPTLETLDQFCALMLRVGYAPASATSEDQALAHERLGYDWWMYKAFLRTEVYEYIQRHWKSLAPLIPTVPPSNRYRKTS